jgi:16S rRNA (adenine1518-N6/adenine1519-N6)-dimethyltransferase
MVMSVGEPSQPTLRRLRRFDIRPNTQLGQNFLIDSNLLGVIERAAELGPDDVALEIGGGLGVLSEHLAPLVAHLHVVEVDPRLEPALRDALDPFDNATLHVADAMDLDLPALAPAPTRVVANLPYGIAASVVLRTIEQLPGVGRWVVMVQREVGERLAAKPGTAAYGVPSALAQLACEVRVLRPVSRSVFVPAPRVDSVLVTLSRIGPAPPSEVRELVRAGFAHRRKAMATSLAQARGARADTAQALTGSARLRERAREALVALGHPADERAERLAPEEFVALARLLEEG